MVVGERRLGSVLENLHLADTDVTDEAIAPLASRDEWPSLKPVLEYWLADCALPVVVYEQYEEGIRAGGIKDEWVEAIEAARPEALERIYHHSYPFDGSWNSWKPEPGWRPPSLPLDWHTL